MAYKVSFSKKAARQYLKLPKKIQMIVDLLVLEIQIYGPTRGNWKNYSKLRNTTHHCHLKTGKPTYVACWKIRNKEINREMYEE